MSKIFKKKKKLSNM